MTEQRGTAEFPEHSAENRRIWNANARWWDDMIGEGNDFQDVLIEPATLRLLDLKGGEDVLDIACGAGRFARRMAGLGARVTAFDISEEFIARARERADGDTSVEYHILDAAEGDAILALGEGRFDRAVCTMALMDMPEIEALLAALARVLKPDGAFVFTVTHPCFHSAAIQRYAEMYEEEAGRLVMRAGVKVWAYRTAFAKKTEGIIGQPEPQFYFHRPLEQLLGACFAAGFVVDALEEPTFPDREKFGDVLRWHGMPDIPPVLAVRMRLISRGVPV